MPFIRPCPRCHQPVTWETAPTRPFCSTHCKTLDLGAWSEEAYRIPDNPSQEEGESWGEMDASGDV